MFRNVLGVAAVYIMLFILDGSSLIRSRRWRELAVLTGLIILGAAFSIYWVAAQPRVPLSKYIVDLFEPIARIVFGAEE